jgi:hypothetical protein
LSYFHRGNRLLQVCGSTEERTFWFKVFGYGLHFKPSRGHVPLFSERYGYRKAFYFGPLRVMVLTP